VLDHTAQGNPEWSGKHPDCGSSKAPWRVYNIGNNNAVELMEFINAIEDALGVKAEMNMLPMQAGDVPATFADVQDLVRDVAYQPSTSIQDGVSKFVAWYRDYYRV